MTKPKDNKPNDPEFDPVKPNWWAMLGTIVVLAIIVIISISQQARPATAPGAAPTSGAIPSTVGPKRYSAAPPMLIDVKKKYTALVKMATGGEFNIELYADKAPLTVNSFVFLAREKFFNGVTFHRVLDGFMAQGGDPTGTGGGGPGYQFKNEDSDLKFDRVGVVAMANAGKDTNGSQFFITFVPTPQLNGGYTIFGQIVKGMEVVNGIKRRDPNANPTFTGDAIETITITEQ
jgi:cyclophilin family peptidyl-prolyl cis-trans isomerase